MMLGIIADDFTGASDIGLTLSSRGMSTVQYIGVPRMRADPSVEAGVVALKIRTSPVTEAVEAALEACDWLCEQGCKQIVYKVCSTFDSTHSGNIGPVGAALAERLGESKVVVCPAFPENGRSVYQGHLFVKDRLLSESGMENHPLTPMTDPDLRRVLARQTEWPVSHVPIGTTLGGADALEAGLAASGKAMVIVDAIRDEDLIEIGKAARDRLLLIGGSGIALGLPANFGIVPASSGWSGLSGPGAVLSGSCSRATREQVETYRSNAPSLEVLAEKVMAGAYSIGELVRWVMEQQQAPLIYSSADPAVVATAQDRFGQKDVAGAVEKLFADLARALVEAGARRIVVAGGETSGAVVAGIGASALEIGPKIAPGVPALRVSDRDVVLALKSGNFGGPQFFAEALETLEGRS
ncbi:four-carbon acid sugar kinase family protein [Shinella sp. 838]|uniref:3-oxo-tetronate kinase n=1 Tax=Shinella sp. 838 TaxID=3038164 RepID=UPI0024154182|nr:3-oxo-tetronate kinase [Shinella sp. 838]MDG4674898.1 four-carbon acid sugar kinase family protein [Shinella sp. 838]